MVNEKRWHFGAMIIGLPVIGTTLLGIVALVLWRQFAPGFSAAPAADRPQPAPQPIAECLARGPAKIAEGIYILGDMRPSAVYVVETSAGLAMIDSGLESAHDRLLAGLAKLDLDLGRLKMILLTHAHGDHTMGAQRLRDLTGAKIYIGRDDAGTLRRGGPWEAIFSKFDIEGEALHPTVVDGELADGQVLELGQARFTVLATPGHTPGSCCFLLQADGQRMLFTGDTISTLTVALGTYSARLPPRYGGDAQRYLRSFETLRQLPAPDLVLPGHPDSDLAAPDPRLTAAEWKSLVDRGIDELRLVCQRYARDGADFLDGRPKAVLDGLYYLGDFDGRAAYALVENGRALLFDGACGEGASRRLASAWQTLGIPAPAVAAVVLTSCDTGNLAGLKEMVEGTGCRVVAPAGCLEAVAAFCPERAAVVAAEELPALGWNNLRAWPLEGLGTPQAAYSFRQGEALVLVSGPAPFDTDAIAVARLERQGPPFGWDARLLASSLERLAEIKPDIWLSAVPLRGRNANLYDRAWADTLRWNEQLLRRWQAGRRPASGG
ncbi:MAG TPA: MBL fold metallo-hydrolase [Pirellulales bacterium]|nr:MBL fold metallo-hydrolase [Pirellulales bacterium]